MRNLIKLIIALLFILGSYILGYYQADEKHSSQIKEINKKLSIEQSSVQQLKDSISKMSMIIKHRPLHTEDTSTTKTKIGNRTKVKK